MKKTAKLVMFFIIYFMVYSVIFKLVFYRYDWLNFSLICTICATIGYFIAKLIRDKWFQISLAVTFTLFVIFVTGVLLNMDWGYILETVCVPFALALLLW